MRRIFIPLVACLIVLACPGRAGPYAVGSAGLALGEELAGSPAVACSPEKPTVLSGDSIGIRVWVDSPPERLRYVWTATGGNIKGQDAEAIWDFKGAAPGIYESTVKATAKTSGSVTCTIQVVVRERLMGGEHG